jgi:hypothetical protein
VPDSLAGISRNMINITHFSLRLSSLALLCACMVMLAWAAPVLVVVSGDLPDILRLSQEHQASDPADVPIETEDASDDPILFLSAGKAHLLLLTFELRTSRVTEQTWAPPAPARPPNYLITV